MIDGGLVGLDVGVSDGTIVGVSDGAMDGMICVGVSVGL